MRFYLVGLMVIFMSIFSGFVFAGDSEDYSKFMKKNYYLLDNQQFSKIKCNVRVPILDTFLTNTRQEFQTAPGKIVIEENVKDFSLVYDKSQGLSFIKPAFNIKALEHGSILNQQIFDQAVQRVEKDLETQVYDVTLIITELFYEYTLSNKKIQNFFKTASGAEVTLEYKGVVSKEKYFESSRTSEFSVSGGRVTGVKQSRFEKIGDNFILSKSNSQIQTLGEYNEDIDLEISYDKLGNVYFPKSIIDKTKVQTNVLKQEIEIDVFLDKCIVE